MNKVYLSTGSNLGDRKANLDTATRMINTKAGKVVASSKYYQSEAWGFNSKEIFLNQILVIETEMDPFTLLSTLQEIESELGRTRVKGMYTNRTIDIDIIFFNDLIIEEERLIVPHPHLTERKFVLLPLEELAAEHIHPVLFQPISKLLKSTSDTSEVLALETVSLSL